MAISLPKTSISILDAQIRLLTIPRDQANAHMFAVTRCLAFRHQLAAQRGRDPFFNLTLNAIELSLFADRELVDRVFPLEERQQLAQAGVEISEDIWIALQVEQHDDDSWDSSGGRVKDISAPLAAEGISILFLSTYISDFLLIKEHRLDLVISILQRESFYSHDEDESGGSSLGFRSQSPFPQTHLDSEDPTPSTSIAASYTQGPPNLSRSLTGSVLLSDRDRSSRKQSYGDSVSPETGPASPVSITTKERSGSITSALSSTRPSPLTLSRIELPAGDAARPNAVAAVTPGLSPSPSSQGHLSVVGGDADGPSPNTSESRPRSYEKMQDSMLSDSTAASGIVDKISLLPDELVCIGLSMHHEKVWRSKLVHALFYYEDVLPPKYQSRRSSFESTSDDSSNEDDKQEHALAQAATDSLNLSGISLTSPRPLLSTTPTPSRPLTNRQTSSSQPARSFSASSHPSVSNSSLLCPTVDADYPTPFLSLTLTVEGCSLIADIRLLRALFENEDESIVYASGQGGLYGLWHAEEGDFSDEMQRERTYSRSRRDDLGRSAGTNQEDEWEPSLDYEEAREDDGDPNLRDRLLFKCLQLDLSSFGLEKAGLAHQFAGLLTDEKINLLYSSTFRTANILVAKRHITKARGALESATRD